MKYCVSGTGCEEGDNDGNHPGAAHVWEDIVLERCGDCGAWMQNPEYFRDEEVANPVLVHCGCTSAHEYDLITEDVF